MDRKHWKMHFAKLSKDRDTTDIFYNRVNQCRRNSWFGLSDAAKGWNAEGEGSGEQSTNMYRYQNVFTTNQCYTQFCSDHHTHRYKPYNQTNHYYQSQHLTATVCCLGSSALSGILQCVLYMCTVCQILGRNICCTEDVYTNCLLLMLFIQIMCIHK